MIWSTLAGISYPESTGSLVSGWLLRETRAEPKNVFWFTVHVTAQYFWFLNPVQTGNGKGGGRSNFERW